MQHELAADQQRRGSDVLLGCLALGGEEQTKRDQRAGRGRAAQKLQEILGGARNAQAGERNDRAEHGCDQQGVAEQRAADLDDDMPTAALGLQAGLDQHDRDREQDAHRHDGGDERRRQRLAAERGDGEREADEAGIAIAGIETVDRRIDQMPATEQGNGDGQAEHQRGADAERRDEGGLPDVAPFGVRDDVEQQRRQREIDDEAVQFARCGRADHADPARQPSGEDEGEDREHGGEGCEHWR